MYLEIRNLSLCLALILTSATCRVPNDGDGDGDVDADGDGDVDGDGDGDGDTDADGDSGPLTCTGPETCPVGMICVGGTCQVQEGECETDDDCDSDTYCHDGGCIPYDGSPRGTSNPDCVEIGLPPTPGVLEPEEQCNWRGAQVIMTPIVVDLDRAELDGATVPEVIFVTHAGYGGSATMYALHGDDCSVYWSVAVPGFKYCGEIAAGDLDGDSYPEIVVPGEGWVGAYSGRDGSSLWNTPTSLTSIVAPSIADVDLDGDPDVVVGNQAFDGPTGLNLWTGENGMNTYPMVVVADVDLDGQPEVVRANRIFNAANGDDETPAAMRNLPEGVIAIGELDLETPEPEIVVVSSSGYGGVSPAQVRVQRVDGTVIFGPLNMPSPGAFAGVPTIADFDGDGRAEFASACGERLNAYDFDCLGAGRPAECADEGLLWSRVVHDVSGAAGVSVFDFQADGRAEVVYADECFLHAFDGITGEPLLAATHTSGTCFEVPTIADVDGDGHTEIIQSENTITAYGCPAEDPDTGTPFRGGVDGITIYRDPEDRWVNSRPIWNQNSYHITNVNADGTIPSPETNNWEVFNNYRQNEPGVGEPTETPSPDATVRQLELDTSTCPDSLTVEVYVANRGTQTIAPGLQVAFYSGAPEEGGELVCLEDLVVPIPSGDRVIVQCVWTAPPSEAVDLYIYADDDGTGASSIGECFEGNNWTVVPNVGCGILQ